MKTACQQQNVTDEPSTKPEVSEIDTREQVVGEQGASRLRARVAFSRPTRYCQSVETG